MTGSFCQALSAEAVSDQFGSCSLAAEELEGCRTMGRKVLPIPQDVPTHSRFVCNQMRTQVCSLPL